MRFENEQRRSPRLAVILLAHPADSSVVVFAKKVFDECDVDKSGKLDTGELDKLLKDLGISCTEEELNQMIKDADDDDDGEIDPDEWNQIVFGLMGLDGDGKEKRKTQVGEGQAATCSDCVIS